MINYNITKEISLFKVKDNYFTANYNGKIYSIGELLFICLNAIQNGKSIDEITEQINNEYNLGVNSDFIKNNVDDFFKKIENVEKNKSTLYNYIYFKIKIFGAQSIKKATKVLGLLFNKYVLMLLIPLGILFSFLLMGNIYQDGIISNQVSFKESFTGFILIYSGITILGLIHEFGHASAAAHYKQPSDSIGFGFYIVFPVFYSDVSKIWNLDKWRRIVVNLGGIYFQLILNILFYFVYLNISNIEDKIVLKYFVFANFILLGYSINPFLRNDGYWVYSDFFEIPNLTEKATKFPRIIMRIMQGNESLSNKIMIVFKQFPLLVYTILYYLIMMLLVVSLLWLTYKNMVELKNIITTWYVFDWTVFSTYKKIITLLFGLFVNIYFSFIIARRFLRKRRF